MFKIGRADFGFEDNLVLGLSEDILVSVGMWEVCNNENVLGLMKPVFFEFGLAASIGIGFAFEELGRLSCLSVDSC